MRLSVLIYVPSARGPHGRRSAMSLHKESTVRIRVTRISTGSRVRFVALLDRFGASVSASGGIATKGGAPTSTSVRVPGLRRFVRSIGPTTLLPLPGAHCGGEAGRPTEIALDGLHLVIAEQEILHVAERLAVFGPTDVHHERVIAVSNNPFQLEALDEINLRLPASRFESALTDVVVVVCARKCEVVRQQDVDRMPVPFLPCCVITADRLFVFRTQPGLRVRSGNSRKDGRRSHCADPCLEYGPARHCPRSHDSFLPFSGSDTPWRGRSHHTTNEPGADRHGVAACPVGPH